MNTDFKNNPSVILRARQVAVIGFGVEGISSAKFLQENGASVWILDKRQKEDFDQKNLAALEALGVEFVLGKDYLKDLSKYDLIVRSPGVKLSLPELVTAKENGVEITSQTKLFFELCPCPIIGVTGTKGKGTTSSLTYEMLKASGRDAYLGGNIGTPPFEFLNKLTGRSNVVLELSSFQLQDLDKSPHIAVMLMVTSDHLDDIGDRNRHDSLEEYIEAKRNILRFQTQDDFAILNKDYPVTHESDIYTEGKVFQVSREREVSNGCFALNGKVVLRKNGNDQEIIKISEILLPGKHNLENVCAAVMAANLAGVNKESMVKVLKSFKGLEHRLELAQEVNGVRYYDDSISTTPETAIAAIEAFVAPKILILGGASKNSDFSELGKVLRETPSIKAIIGVGEEWYRIKEQLPEQKHFLVVEDAQDMQTIVQAASKIATTGDVVLLSPACTSFDMFKNYKERGDQFKKEVAKLALA